MDQKTLTFIITGIAAAVYIVQLVSIPFRTKKLLAVSGKVLMALPNAVPFRLIAIFAVCALLIFIVPLRNFALYIQVVFLIASLLGEKIAVQEASGLAHAGVYENMVIFGANAILFSDIESLPTLSYENDPETVGVDKTSIRVILKNGSEVLLSFNDESLRSEVVKLIVAQEKRLGNHYSE